MAFTTDSHAEKRGAISEVALDEIVVTAKKRGEQSLLEMSMAISALPYEEIWARNLVQMIDYLPTTPGVSYFDRGVGRNTIMIRGLSSAPEFDQATVALYFNETVVTGLGTFGLGHPDLQLVDIERIEVLRGPQGTLYGESSMAGTVRIISAAPALDEIQINAKGEYSYTAGFGSDNHNVSGMINIPLAENRFAVRAVAYLNDTSGYYKNIAGSDPTKQASAAVTSGLAVDQNNVGAAKHKGGRLSTRWEPLDDLSLDLILLTQEANQDGFTIMDLNRGFFEHAKYQTFDGRTEEFNHDISIANFVAEYDFKDWSILYSGSWIETDSFTRRELGFALAPSFGDDFPIFIDDAADVNVFDSEIRILSELDGIYDILLGSHYYDGKSDLRTFLYWGGDPAADPFGGSTLLDVSPESDFEGLSFFAELTVRPTNKIDATVGVRQFKYKGNGQVSGEGVFFGPASLDFFGGEWDDNTAKADISYRISDKSTVFFSWSEGYRPGGLDQQEVPIVCDTDSDGIPDGLSSAPPTKLAPDEVENTEIGGHFRLFSGRVHFSASVFQMDWTGIPVTLFAACGFPFNYNLGRVDIAGAEFETAIAINSNLQVDLTASYTNSELAIDTPNLGDKGDRLPGTPKFNARLGAQFETDFAEKPFFARADLSYVDEFFYDLSQSTPTLGDYFLLNVSVGMTFGQFLVKVFGTNLTNDNPIIWKDILSQDPFAHGIRPRTMGVSFEYRTN